MKAEALRELEAITDSLRKNLWRSRDCTEKCVRTVSRDIQLLVADRTWPGRWTPGAIRIRCFRPLPGILRSTCSFPRAGAAPTVGCGPPPLWPASSRAPARQFFRFHQ